MNCRVLEDIPSGFYKSVDDISNFKIRVCIQKSVPSCFPQSESPECSQSESVELVPLHTPDKKKIILERVFSWQEKISKAEEREMSASSLQTWSKSSGRLDSHIRLFTYVDSELRSSESKSPAIQLRYSTKAECILKGKNPFYSGNNRTYQKPFIVETKDVIQNNVSKKPYEFVGQMMAIMAFFDAADKSEDLKEVQVCLMHYDSNGVLQITPDFNRAPYLMQNFSTENYELILENASSPMNKLESQKSEKLLKQVANQHAKIVAQVVGTNFDKPPPDDVVFYIYGAIESAEEFDCKYVFVRCSFEVNETILIGTDELLPKVTHSCKMKWKNNVKVAEFSDPFNYQVLCNGKQLSNIDRSLLNIRLIVEVTSMDYWGLLRNEGYGFCNVPLQPGYYDFKIRTWKLMPLTLHEKLRNFFIGGMPNLSDPTIVTVPKQLQDPQLNKCGIRSETSGSVYMKIHMVMHYGCESSPHNLIHKQQVTSNH